MKYGKKDVFIVKDCANVRLVFFFQIAFYIFHFSFSRFSGVSIPSQTFNKKKRKETN